MPKMRCLCGKHLALSEIPNPIEWRLMSDVQFDQYQGLIDVEVLYQAMTRMVKCPSCSRIYVFWNGFDQEPEVYIPE